MVDRKGGLQTTKRPPADWNGALVLACPRPRYAETAATRSSATGTRCIRIHTEGVARRRGIRKYPRKLGSLRRAESVADRAGAEEKTELGLIYGCKFSSGEEVGTQSRRNSLSTLFLSLSLYRRARQPPVVFSFACRPRPPLSRARPLPPTVTTAISRGTSRARARVKTYEHICTASITRADETWRGHYGGAMKTR